MKINGRWLIPLCEAYSDHTIVTPWKNHRRIKRICKKEGGCSWRQRRWCLGGMKHWHEPALCDFVYAQMINEGAELVYVSKLQAIEAIDFGFKESGKIIIAARVGGHDHVKIIDTPRDWALQEYQHLTKRLEQEYGARASRYDMPPGMRWRY